MQEVAVVLARGRRDGVRVLGGHVRDDVRFASRLDIGHSCLLVTPVLCNQSKTTVKDNAVFRLQHCLNEYAKEQEIRSG